MRQFRRPAPLADRHAVYCCGRSGDCADIENRALPAPGRVARHRAVHLPAERGALQRAHDVGGTGPAVHSARLRHRVTHAPGVVHAHHVEVRQHHLGAARVVPDKRAEGAHEDVVAWSGSVMARRLGRVQKDLPARADAHSPPQRVVLTGVYLRHQIEHTHHAGLELEPAFDDVRLDLADGLGDGLARRHVALLLDVDADCQRGCLLAVHELVADVHARDAGALEQLCLGRFLDGANLAHRWHGVLL